MEFCMSLAARCGLGAARRLAPVAFHRLRPLDGIAAESHARGVRVFVLTTGRSGSLTFATACGHITNFTVGHESLRDQIGEARFAYPDNHIEVDNRLSWFPGQLARRFPDARYVHLVRDPVATADSYLERWPGEPKSRLRRLRRAWSVRQPEASLMRAFANGIVFRLTSWPEEERRAVSEFMVDTINANIREFLSTREHLTVELEVPGDGFRRFWDWIDAEGDQDAAMREWDVRRNARKGTWPQERALPALNRV